MRIRSLSRAICGLMVTLAAMTFSAGAQGNYQNHPVVAASRAESDPPAKAAQPTERPDNSWIDNKTYVIGESDVLDINVWKEKDISRGVLVRLDGKISLPLIGEIQASGVTPLQLRDDIARRLKDYIENPVVTVIVNEPHSHHFNIIGQVNKTGTFPLTESMTVFDAIAAAGGFKDFAKSNKIYVLRSMPGGERVRLPFNYKEVIKGKNEKQNILLKPGDTIVVP
jgi:polysaccharide export outer membrane protein